MTVDAAVIGGGFAGVAAAARLAEAGLRVVLLDKKGFLGGRVYSIRERKSGDVIDNGQHLLMGCYHETLSLLRLLGTEETVRFQERLAIPYRGPNGFYDELNCPRLPAPLHLLAGMFRMSSLTWRDKWAAMRYGMALKVWGGPRDGETVAAFARRVGQTEAIQERMWNPIAISALNESVDRADARLFATVMRQGFMASFRDSLMVFPIAPLSELLGAAAIRFIEERGGRVRLRETAQRIDTEGDRVTAVLTASGERIECGACVSALPAQALRSTLEASGLNERVDAPDLGASAILSVYLWFEDEIAEEPLCCLQNSAFEWIFHRHRFMRIGEHKKPCLCLVASAADRFAHRTREELVELALRDARNVYPHAERMEPLCASVFWEPRATFSTTPENARRRPNARTNLANLYLAGDWTDTGLPATIEGATLSGNMAAQCILDTNLASAQSLR